MFMLFRFTAWLMVAFATCFQHTSVLARAGRNGHLVGYNNGEKHKFGMSNLISRTAFIRSESANQHIRSSLTTTNLGLFCGECTPGIRSSGGQEGSGCSNKECACHTTGVCTCACCTCGPACPCQQQQSKKDSKLGCGCTEIMRCKVHQ